MTDGRARRWTRGPRGPEVARITAVAEPLAEDLNRRARRYLLQMSIRVVCFFGAVLVDHWSRWLMLAGAVVLPYVAVVLANAGRERPQDPGTFVERPTLPSGPSAHGAPR